jgi:hypothetical protein
MLGVRGFEHRIHPSRRNLRGRNDRGGHLRSLLIFAVCTGGVVSFLVLRGRWHGWNLAGAIFVSMYGISTVANQLDSVAFLSNKLPQGMIRALFVQGAISAALFAPLAVLVLGKWRVASAAAPLPPAAPWKVGWLLPRVGILVGAFVFLYISSATTSLGEIPNCGASTEDRNTQPSGRH